MFKVVFVLRTSCSGFAWPGFGSRGSTGVASVRSFKEIPQCLAGPIPGGSKNGHAADQGWEN